jgi:hypothetical protein
VRTSRLSSISLALVCVLLTAVSARAQTGTISGTVVEDGTSTPLFGTGAQAFLVVAYNAFGTTVGNDQTDATGQYAITLTPGSYYLKVTAAPGHVPELHNNIACIAVDCTQAAGTPVVVTSNATMTVDFSLAVEGTITGTVSAAGGGLVNGITVNIYTASTSFVKSVTTAIGGTYTVNGLAAGTYLARTTLPPTPTPLLYVTELYGGVQCPHLAPETDCRIASSAPITVTAGAVTSGVDFLLDLAASISGTVTSAGFNVPLANVGVSAYAGDVLMGTAATDASGNYVMTALPPGRYRLRTTSQFIDEWHNDVCVGCPGPTATIQLATGQNVTGVNFGLTVGGVLGVTVTCDTRNDPTAFFRGPEIAVFSSTGEFVRSVSLQHLQCPSSTAQGALVTTITGLATGTYFLWARDTPLVPMGTNLIGGAFVDQLFGGIPCNTVDCDVRKGVPVSVTAGGAASATFALKRGAGFVLSTNALAVKVYDARGIETVNAIGRNVGAGWGIVDGLPPGTYFLTSEERITGAISCIDCPPTAGVPIVLDGNGATGWPTLGPLGFWKVSGTITNASGGAPLSTIAVQLVSRGGQVVASAISDLSGRYTLRGVPPGTYFARTANDRGFVDEVYSDAGCGTCDPRSGTPIVVVSSPDPHDVTGIDFALAAGGVVSGLVSDTNGAALGAVPVSLFAGTTTFAGVKTTSPSGRYRLTLPAGTYRALAEASTNKGSEVYSEMPCTSASCDPSTGTPIAVTTGNITSAIDFTLTSCSAMSVSPSILATGVSGRTYRQVFSAAGGTGPYTFDVTDGVLPLGVTLNAASGVLEGTPTVSGRSSFRVSALDANGCATDRSYVLDVHACAFTLSPASATVAATGGNVIITIANSCGAQEVTEGSDWIMQSPNIPVPGTVTLIIAANTQGPRLAVIGIGRRPFEIRQAGVESTPPYGLLDLPVEGAQVSGATAVGGWALDDLEVARVRIYRDSVAGEPAGMVLLGDAIFIPGARPDVQQAAPNVPHNDRAGFGFMILTNTLPNQGNGSFRIHAVAEDAEGRTTLLGSRTIVGNNTASQQPFGTIDTPLQGQTIAGSSYINFGWALTPQPAMIPTDGSTMQVIIDGVPIGNPAYNFFRPDVSNTFPGLANSGGPVGYRIFDTTALAEGLHTISWSVTDNRPATSGIGSRYFNVANSADAAVPAGSVTSTQTELEATDVAKPLGAAPAPDLGRRAESLAVAANDAPTRRHTLTLAPMERLEVALDSLVGAVDEACPATWAGYLSKDNVLTDLPIGASLDPAGTFYWQTGPGFAGRFPLVFVRTNCRGEKQHVPITVTIPIR